MKESIPVTVSIPNFENKVSYIESIKEKLLSLANKNGTPLFIYDKTEVEKNLRTFREGIIQIDPNAKIFYAIKSNPYEGLLNSIVEKGGFLDASSSKELDLAVKAGAKEIILTGPGKENKELEIAVLDSERIFIHIDSFSELKKISDLAKKHNKKIKCGVRVSTSFDSAWGKFGIPLNSLKEFLEEARKSNNISITALHTHQSHNRFSDTFISKLNEIADYLFSGAVRSFIEDMEVLDIGGGFVPEHFEGIYPWNEELDFLYDNSDKFEDILKDKFKPRFLVEPSQPFNELCKDISKIWNDRFLSKKKNLSLWVEPGRIISHSSMHLIFSVRDLKTKQSAILDGGMNMIGYERYQYLAYVPTFNLSKFSSTNEFPILLYGPLCTPDDLWGYYLYGTSIAEGDLILLPFQGDYTYGNSQTRFIKDDARVVELL